MPWAGCSRLCCRGWVTLYSSVFNSKLWSNGAGHGTILSVNAAGVVVQCGQGVLRLTELQRAGGKRLPVAEFLRGFALLPGQVLGRSSTGAPA